MEHFLVFGLVENRMQPAAQLRKAGDLQVFVFKKQSLVRPVIFGSGEMVLHWIRIDDGAFDGGREFHIAFECPELGIDILGPSVSGNRDGTFPCFDVRVASARKNKTIKKQNQTEIFYRTSHNFTSHSIY